MLVIHTNTRRIVGFFTPFLLSGLLLFPNFSFASDLSGSKSQNGNTAAAQKHGEKELPKGHRYIEGTVEDVNENTIRVDAGEVGDITPRYLNLDNIKGNNDDIKKGDTLQIEVNAQNKVVKYKKVSESKKKQKM